MLPWLGISTCLISCILRISQKLTRPSLLALAKILFVYFCKHVTVPKLLSSSRRWCSAALTSQSLTELSKPLDKNVFSVMVHIYCTPVDSYEKVRSGDSVSIFNARNEYIRIFPSEQPVRKTSFDGSGSCVIDDITPLCWFVSRRTGRMTSEVIFDYD